MPETLAQATRSEGLTSQASTALGMFERSVRQSYGDDLLRIVLFGSRARGDAGPESDVDVAVVLDRVAVSPAIRDRLADIAYEAIIETYIDVQALPISRDEWEHPELHSNPALIRTIKRDGVTIERGHEQLPQ
jgi:predicted nucleotidyltransferase